jgi:fructose-bisphosphate aldolase class II
MEAWCYQNCADERGPDQTDEQFVYKTRKKALGPYKRQLWELATRDEILADQQAHMRYLFEQLGVAGSRGMIERYITPVAQPRPAPEAVRQAAETAARR